MFFDVNLTTVLAEHPGRVAADTLEVRTVPGSLDTGQVMAQAALVEVLLSRCRSGPSLPRSSTTEPRRAADELLGLAREGR